jgi:hypothetical protein
MIGPPQKPLAGKKGFVLGIANEHSLRLPGSIISMICWSSPLNERRRSASSASRMWARQWLCSRRITPN